MDTMTDTNDTTWHEPELPGMPDRPPAPTPRVQVPTSGDMLRLSLELADEVGCSPQTATELLVAIEDQGYIIAKVQPPATIIRPAS
jgi:hypothetical protein